MEYGFVKVASAVPTVKVADCRHNAWQMAEMIADAANQNVEIIIFPELSITKASCSKRQRNRLNGWLRKHSRFL